jgi:hypothetical protein
MLYRAISVEIARYFFPWFRHCDFYDFDQTWTLKPSGSRLQTGLQPKDEFYFQLPTSEATENSALYANWLSYPKRLEREREMNKKYAHVTGIPPRWKILETVCCFTESDKLSKAEKAAAGAARRKQAAKAGISRPSTRTSGHHCLAAWTYLVVVWRDQHKNSHPKFSTPSI